MALGQLLGSVHGLEMNWRVAMWRDCTDVVRERPWFGVGPRNFKYQDPERHVRTWAYSDHAHNVLVNIATETGLAGLAAFLLFLGATLRASLRQPLPWCFLTQGVVLVLIVAGLATTTFHTEGGMLFALLVGTALGASRVPPAA
jgi:O-antigen ligase